MAKFEGYLLKNAERIFPLKYIVSDTYKATPNQRTESKAYTDSNNYVKRSTFKHTHSKIEFETPKIWLDELEEIKQFFDEATIDALERKIEITYWNDEELRYKKMTAYKPDIEYTISNIYGNDILYNPIRIAIIEY